jgi:hypothetical protein
MIKGWWESSGEPVPSRDLLPVNSTFIAELSGAPALAVCLYLTNTPELAFVENFIGNPRLKGARRQAVKPLLDYITGFAKAMGYRRLFCMTDKESLVKHYMELGFVPTLSGVTTLVRGT